MELLRGNNEVGFTFLQEWNGLLFVLQNNVEINFLDGLDSRPVEIVVRLLYYSYRIFYS